MPYVEIDPRPGLFLDETPRVAKDFWASTELVRWLRGRLQPIGGWAKLNSTVFTGIARGFAQWASNDGTKRFALGTHTKFWTGTSSALQDITPTSSMGALGTNPFSVTASSTTVTVAHTAHGRAVSDSVWFLNAESVGGVTINGKYSVVTVPDANSYTITHSSAALATGSGGGTSVAYLYELAVGNVDGSSSADPRIVTVEPWGEYVLFNPRGGGLYEWQLADAIATNAREFSADSAQLVLNPNFDADQDWTKGSGWSIAAGGGVCAGGTGSLTQAITINNTVEYELIFQCTSYVSGEFRARYNNSTLGGNVTNTGTYVRYFNPSNSGNLEFDSIDASAFNGQIDNIRMRRRPRVKNGSFIDNFSVGTWTAGAGWTHDPTNFEADAAAGSASTLTQSLSSTHITAGDTYVVIVNLTRTAGTVTIRYNSVDIGAAISATGVYVRSFTPAGNGNIEFSKDSSFAGSIHDVQIYEIGEVAELIANAPARIDSILVTAENFVLALGCTSVAGTYDPMLIRCCDQGDNTTWTPSSTNAAKEFQRLPNGSKIVRGIAGRLENLIFTDTALYSCRFNPDATVVYAFDQIADNCGLVSPNAVAVLDGVVYWLSTNGKFYRYAGGQPEALECPLQKYMWDNITANQKWKIAARTVAQFGEIWWHYPRSANTECSHYLKYNARENGGLGAWDHGTMVRTIGDDVGVFGYPLACDASGYVQQHENGSSADGSAMTWSARTGYRDISSGNAQMDVFSFLTDWDDQAVNVNLSILTRDYPNSSATTDGPYSLTTATDKTDLRSSGREMALEFSGTSTASFARIGACRIEVQPNGERL